MNRRGLVKCVSVIGKLIGIVILSWIFFSADLFNSRTARCNTKESAVNISPPGGKTNHFQSTPQRFMPLPNFLDRRERARQKVTNARRGWQSGVNLSRQREPLPANRHPSKWSDGQQHPQVNLTFVKVMVSSMTSTRHSAPWGTASYVCSKKSYDISKLPSVSVILTFHENEQLARILHTIHSVIQRTPPTLIEEILLIDDHTSKEEFKDILPFYIKSVFGSKVKLHHNVLRKGLIGARLAGTRLAKADVIVSMDSHMEVQERWLEPLLAEIAHDRKTMAAAYLDWMEYDMIWKRWAYRHGASSWKTYFDWAFNVGFQDIPSHVKKQRDPTMAVNTPVTIGTLFAMDRQFFLEIGEFDGEMEGWGGENIDLPIRVWLFGGRVVNVPCSHAAHYESSHHRDYRRTWGLTITRNYRRVADVWLGNYSRYFFTYKRGAKVMMGGDISSREALRNKSSHNFDWYLRNVFPELGIPDVHTYAWGGLMHIRTGLCLEVFPPGTPYLSDCNPRRQDKQGFFWAVPGELRFPLHAFSAVHGRAGPDTPALRTEEWITNYNTSNISKWIHWKGGPLMDWTSRRCLSVSHLASKLLLSPCNASHPDQQWTFRNYTANYRQLLSPLPSDRGSHFQRRLRDTIRSVNIAKLRNSSTPL